MDIAHILSTNMWRQFCFENRNQQNEFLPLFLFTLKIDKPLQITFKLAVKDMFGYTVSLLAAISSSSEVLHRPAEYHLQRKYKSISYDVNLLQYSNLTVINFVNPENI